MFNPVTADAVEASTLRDGVVVPLGPTARALAPVDVTARPAAASVANVVAPLLPPLNAKASVVPMPVVVCSVSCVPVVPEPPMTNGTVTDVVTVCAGSVVDQDGTPAPLVTRMLLLAVARPLTTLAVPEYKSWLTVVVAGYVAVDQEGALLEPDSRTWFAVAVPDRTAIAEAVE